MNEHEYRSIALTPPTSSYTRHRHTHHFGSVGINCTLHTFHADSTGLSAELEFRYDQKQHPNNGAYILDSRLNLLASRSASSLVSDLERDHPGYEWQSLVEYVRVRSKRQYRQGEPILSIGDQPPPGTNQVWRLQPYLREGTPTSIYGPAKLGKSWLALLFSLLIQSGQKFGSMEPLQGNVLYLDYEDDADAISSRIWALKKGLGIDPLVSITYRYGGGVLHADAERLGNEVADNKIKFLVVDSVTAGLGGEMMDAGVISSFHETLRELHVTTLLVDHQGKGGPERGIIGSSSKLQRSRSVFRVKGSARPNADMVRLQIIHEDINNGKLLTPRGIEFHFGNEEPVKEIRVREVSMQTTTEEGK